MKNWLESIEKLLIEEQCHTAEDGKAIAGLLELINRDEARPATKDDYFYLCPVCKHRLVARQIKYRPTFCCDCGQRIQWKRKRKSG